MADRATIEAEIWLKKLDQITKALDVKKRKEILDKAAVPIVNRARKKAPTGSPRRFAGAKGAVSLRYDTPKVASKLKAPKGSGRIVARYYKRNLALSIRLLNLKRSKAAIIGPKIGGRRGDFGKSDKKVDGFYAQMVYGSAKAFFSRVMFPAAQSAQRKAFAIAKRLIRNEVERFARQKGIN